MQLSQDNQHWLDEFRARHGRSPRVLHIGNIANNAYNNAKLLNEAGLDCDVICYDYYHIMGCPEWEDADFSGDYGDDFSPNWSAVNLCGFERPRWFAQGPVQYAIRYLRARRGGASARAMSLWQRLAVANKTANRTRLRFDPSVFAQWWLTLATRIAYIKSRLIELTEGKGVATRVAKVCDQGQVAVAARSELSRLLAAWILLSVAICIRAYRSMMHTFTAFLRVKRPSVGNVGNGTVNQRYVKATTAFKREFPEREDLLVTADVPVSLAHLPWANLFSQYDYLIGYSTDPQIPMLLGFPYFAFEHGTIRDIPYKATAEGRLTSLSYRLAEHVFVTNFDCVSSAERLAPGRFTVINHPYDEDHGLSLSGAEAQREELLKELDSDFLFFHPTRQDWVEGSGYADKSNEVFLHAFGALRRQGYRVGLVACAWGANIAESKRLLEESGCSGYVRWVRPMAITPFERMCRAADIVVDQFKLGAFGGVVFKAMAVGTPILTYLDEAQLARQYLQCPPVINCRTTDEIVARMTGLIGAPGELVRAGSASREWMKRFHAKEMTVNAQVDQFRRHPSISATETGSN